MLSEKYVGSPTILHPIQSKNLSNQSKNAAAFNSQMEMRSSW